MIAIFSTAKEFSILKLKPKEMFINIHSPIDIMGRTFTGAIFIYSWYDSPKRGEAFDLLKKIQPELFNKNNKTT